MYQFCEIPIEPKGKGRPRFVAGHAYTPAATRDYERAIADWYSKVAHCGKMTGPLKVSLNFLLPIPASWSASKKAAAVNGSIKPDKKPDADNLIKAVLDALNGLAWDDDKQIVELHAQKRYSALPRVCIDIEEATDDETNANGLDGGKPHWSEDESGTESQKDQG